MMVVFLGVVVAVATACGGTESPNRPLSCTYEQRSTSCSSSSFGAWKKKCLDLDDPRDGLTPSQWCRTATAKTTACAAGCCLRFQFRNAVGHYGLCSSN